MVAQQLASHQTRAAGESLTPVNFLSYFLVQLDMRANRSRELIRVAICVIFLAVASAALTAQENPQQLVKETVDNELHVNQQQNYWMYRDSDTEHGKAKVSRVVETPECWFRWMLSINGQPLTPAEEKQQQAKINTLVNSPAARQKDHAAIEQDGNKAENLMKMLPSAFLYTYAGEKEGNVRLNFTPNPQFHPPTDAAKVFHSMQGYVLINRREKRLAGISGTLMQNVDFGWGILGKLDKGGTFKVRQTQLAPNDWEVTTLDVHIHGRALFFHTISEDQTEVKTEFQPVPANTSLAQAAALAQHGNLNASASANP